MNGCSLNEYNIKHCFNVIFAQDIRWDMIYTKFTESDNEFQRFRTIIIILNNLILDLQIVHAIINCRSHAIRTSFNKDKIN